MPYLLLRVQSGWLTNDNGDFYVEDTEQNCRMWVPNNLIGFHENNEVYFKNQNNDNITKEAIQIVDISHEFKERNNNDVESHNNELHQCEDINLSENSSSCTKENRNTWSINQTRALITAVEARYEDMYHVHKRKNFWAIISEELGSQSIEMSESTCKKKWQNLVRTYKSAKDIKSRSGRGPVKFTFYDRLDELLGDSPSNCSPHSIDVDNLQPQDVAIKPLQDSNSYATSEPSCSTDSFNKKKRKNPSLELFKAKKKCLEEKMEKMTEKDIMRKRYIEESLKLKKEKLDLYKEKLELEKRKINALEAFMTKK